MAYARIKAGEEGKQTDRGADAQHLDFSQGVASLAMSNVEPPSALAVTGHDETAHQNFMVVRRDRLRDALGRAGCSKALVTDVKSIRYLFGRAGQSTRPAAGLVDGRGHDVLAVPAGDPSAPPGVEVVAYQAADWSTLRDDLEDAAVAALAARVPERGPIMVDRPTWPWSLGVGVVDARPTLRLMRRHKDPDEVLAISRAIMATEAGYAAVATRIAPGWSEIELFSAFQEATVVAARAPLGELGNDFRGGAPGGSPRDMALVAGDLIPVDAGAVVDGYNADLCRTFAVSGAFDPAQAAARDRVVAALERAEALIEPGRPCADVFAQVAATLDGYRGWEFRHHLGHGIGLSPHEAPRLNPASDDRFAVGDVFTLEPGLYDPSLRAGVRIEDDYLLASDGLRRLSRFPRVQ